MEKKYLVFPNHVKSKYDGDEHYIGFIQLCNLYKVNPKECINMDRYDPRKGFKEIENRNYIALTPRYDGNYSLKES